MEEKHDKQPFHVISVGAEDPSKARYGAREQLAKKSPPRSASKQIKFTSYP